MVEKIVEVIPKVEMVSRLQGGMAIKATEVEDKLVNVEFKLVEEVCRVCDRVQLYTFPAYSKEKSSVVVITSTILICDCITSILFDPRSTFSYLVHIIFSKLGIRL